MHLDEIFRIGNNADEFKTIGNIWQRAIPLDSAKAALTSFRNTRKTGGDGTTYPSFTPKQVLPSVKVFGKTEKTIVIDDKRYAIPDDVELVDYIESTGTQYIDTGLIGSEKTKIIIDFAKTDNTDDIVQILGSITTSTRAISCNIGRANTSTSRFGAKSYSGNIINDTDRHTLEYSNSGLKMDDTSIWTPNASAFTTPDNMRLIGAASSNSSLRGKTYSAQFYDNGTLIRAMYPAIKNSVIGMYDFITGQFFTNAGTGTFTAGKKTKSVRTAQMVSFNAEGAIKLNANCSSGAIVAAANRWMLCIPVKGNTTYSFLVDDTAKTNGWYFAQVSADTVAIGTSYTNFTNRKGYNNATVTTASNTKWIIMYPSLDLADAEAWYDSGITMVEGSTIPTGHIPYTIEVPLFELYGVGDKVLDIPDEYEVVEYIADKSDNGTKTVVIDTGIPGDDDDLEFEFEVYYDTYEQYGRIFGNYVADASNGWRLILGTGTDPNYFNANAKCSGGDHVSAFNINHWHKVIFNKQKITIDGTEYNVAHTGRGTTNNANISLFSFLSVTNHRYIGLKCRYFKIRDNGTLVRNFIPVKNKSTNEYGMYDLVTKQFYGNAGTGSFTGGSVVPNYKVDTLLDDETPYTFYLDRQLNAVGSYEDTLTSNNDGTGSITGNAAVIVLDGTEGWSNTLFPQTDAYRISWTGATAILGAIRYGGLFCTHFEDGGSASTPEPNKMFFANDLNINFPKTSDFDTVSKCRQYLAQQYANGTPVTVVYPLATPVTTPLTGLPVISLTQKAEHTMENVNTVKGQMQVKYLGK